MIWRVVTKEAAFLADSPVVLALCAAFFFGLALVLTQFGLRYMPPSRGALITLPAGAVVLWVLAAIFLDWREMDPHALAIFVAAGMIFPGIVTLLTYEANRQMGPAIAGALGNMAPVFAVPLAVVFLDEMPRLLQWAGIAIILVGVVILSLGRRGLATSWPYWAMALPVGAAAIRGVSQSIIKSGLTIWPSPLAAVLVGYTTSSVVVSIISFKRAGGWPSGFHRSGILWFGGVALCNAIAVFTMYGALRYGHVVLVSPLVATYPLVTLALSWLFLKTAEITVLVTLGVLVTVVGVAILVCA
jgi:drug/metabolite transporter (DMT)-like permease